MLCKFLTAICFVLAPLGVLGQTNLDDATWDLSLGVSYPWTVNNYKSVLNEIPLEKPESEANFNLLDIAYIFPFNVFSSAYMKVFGRDSDHLAELVFEYCKQKEKELSSIFSVEQNIACLSTSIKFLTYKKKWYGPGVSKDFRTYCALTANAFYRAFKLLNIPKSGVGFTDGTNSSRGLHVVNTISFTSPEGEVFGYVIDVSTRPSNLFPSSQAAIRYHDRDGDNKSEFFYFPNIDFTQPAKTKAWKPAK